MNLRYSRFIGIYGKSNVFYVLIKDTHATNLSTIKGRVVNKKGEHFFFS